MINKAQKCKCDGVGWVCESHPDQPWDEVSAASHACGCGPGVPCVSCNLDLSKSGFEGGYIIASVYPIPGNQRLN